MTRPAPGWQVWTALGLVYVLWGSTYLAIAYVVEGLPPLLTASLRFLTAAGLLCLWLRVRRGPQAFRATRRQWAGAAGVGLLLLTGGNGGVTLAEDADLPSGLAALLVAAVPLWVVLLRALARDRPSGRTVLGVVVGFAGLAVLLLPGARPSGVPVFAVAVCLGSSVLWATGSVLGSRLDLPGDALLTAVVQMLGGAAGLAVAGLVRGERLEPERVTTSSLVALAHLVVLGSIVAFTAYSWLLRVAPVSRVSTYAYVNPVVAVLLGALLLDERLTTTTAVGGAVTLLAVAIVVSEGAPAVPAEAPGQARPQTEDERQGRSRSSRT